MPLSSASKFEWFFREVASLDVDKDDLKRYSGFINGKLHDLLVVGQATATANRRDIMEPFDLPITKGLQQSIDEFKRLDTEIDLKTVLEGLTTRRYRGVLSYQLSDSFSTRLQFDNEKPLTGTDFGIDLHLRWEGE